MTPALTDRHHRLVQLYECARDENWLTPPPSFFCPLCDSDVQFFVSTRNRRAAASCVSDACKWSLTVEFGERTT